MSRDLNRSGCYYGRGCPAARLSVSDLAPTLPRNVRSCRIIVGGNGSGAVDSFGIVRGLLTAVLYAAGVLMQRSRCARVDAGLVAALPFAPRAAGELADASGGAIAGVVFLGHRAHRDRLYHLGVCPRPAPTPGAWRRPRCASRLWPCCCRG